MSQAVMNHNRGLPLEALVNIMSNFGPREIIEGPRGVSKDWDFASRSSKLWKIILRRICTEDSLFLPSYPLEAMSAKQLEQASIAPSRLLSMLDVADRPASRRASGRFTIKFGSIFNSNISLPKTLMQLYIVPGGRFLITDHLEYRNKQPSSGTGVRYLSVWDIGWLTMKVKDSVMVPFAALYNRVPACSSPVHPTRDGKELLVFSKEPNRNAKSHRTQHFYVYKLCRPTSLAPNKEISDLESFLQVGQLSLNNILEDKVKVSFSFEYMAITLSDKQICVWNFVNDTKAIWTAPILEDGAQIHTIMLKNEYVIVIRDDDVLIWKIPSLYPSNTALSNDRSHTLVPIWNSSLNAPRHPLSDILLPCSVYQIDNWYTDLGHPIYFDVFPDLSLTPRLARSLPSACRYKLDIPQTPEDINIINGHRAPFDASLTKIGEFTHQSKGDVSLPRIYQGNLFASRYYDDKLLLHCASPTPIVSDGSRTSFSLLELIRCEFDHIAVCPSSGRILLIPKQTNRQNSNKLMILDLYRHDWLITNLSK